MSSYSQIFKELREKQKAQRKLIENRPKRTFKNALDFFDQTQGITPTPQQRFLIKLLFRIPLDDRVKCIEIYDRFVENLEARLTEKEFFQYLAEKRWINLTDPEQHLDAWFTEFIAVIGRRGSKSFFTGGLSTYQAAELLDFDDPHKFFNLTPGDEFNIKSIAPTKKQGKLVFNFAKGFITGNPFFKQFKPNILKERCTFLTRKELYDVNRGVAVAHPEGSIVLLFDACMASKLRGPAHYMLTMDESAFFEVESESQVSDSMIYEAVEPSLSTFKAQQDGVERLYSMMCIISSPLSKSGLLYDKYRESFTEIEDILMIQAPSWIMNPDRVATKILKRAYNRNPDVFDVEYGAMFKEGTYDWFPEALYDACLLEEPKRPIPGVWYYLGLDLGQKQDATVISISHITSAGELVIDEIRTWDPEETGMQTPTDWVIDNVLELKAKYGMIKQGLGDQFAEFGFETLFANAGIKFIKFEQISNKKKEMMFSLVKSLALSDRLRLPENEGLRKECSKYREVRKNNKVYYNKVAGEKDDHVDSFVRAIWVADQFAKVSKHGRERLGDNRNIHLMGEQRRQARYKQAQQRQIMRRLKGRGGRGGGGLIR